ncbi:MAG: RluA family pseudouridine synthase [Kofleriaceae bacterium]
MSDEPEPEPDLDEVHRIEVQAAGRLDAVITAALTEVSRAQVQKWIEDERVTVNGVAVTKTGAKVRALDAIELSVPPPVALEVLPEPIPLVVLFEDIELIVIDKPAGLVVHPAPGHASGTLVNALLFHCSAGGPFGGLSGIGGVMRPGIVHRLDKDTSGVMVVAKTDRAHAALTQAFAAKSRGETGGIERSYLAITSPAPPAKRGVLRTLYGRHPALRKKFSSKVESGKTAVTHWEVVEPLHDAALVKFVLETGRTHQIRVHASDHGWALVGDTVYGHKPRDERLAEVATTLGRQALHAAVLAFDHPVTGERLRFEAPLPPDLVAARAALALP